MQMNPPGYSVRGFGHKVIAYSEEMDSRLLARYFELCGRIVV